VNFSNISRDSDFAKAVAETFKSLEKKPAFSKRMTGVTISNTKLIEETLLPMLTAVDT
jgi:hypothetical protein